MSKASTEFLVRLADLLAEYKMEIGYTLEGDTYGIYDEQMCIRTVCGKRVLVLDDPPMIDCEAIRKALAQLNAV